ncbi:glycerophosphoryl diester phosphodiesterase [Phycicoccus badiiscoriae]|uniref:Glycerophosphoryl diester phosphodiesterase n=1 Tax=Pedococcus badiiscoriae TaxID=642776 RepID=A0A852WGG5_9MICO|nr:glycerophosphodiester phosphodiesterase family protein [Pedococcus badiiscoriae]NYG06611.1 glycerophosphoryl diester phosphodiesterase [Pedococcus badiiscoriae]
MPYGTESVPLALAHRGGAALAPENTIAAFALSSALGVRYLETDVRLTADGALVCFHDSTLDRVTQARGPLARHTLGSLREVLVDGREPIPTLAEVLEMFPDANITVDLKGREAIGPLGKLLRHKDFRDRVCVAGAWDGWLDVVRAAVPGVRTALGWRSLTAVVTTARAGMPPARRFATAEFAHVPLKLGRVPVFVERLVDGAHRIGVRVVVWTVNDPATMGLLLDAGVDGIITDRPDLLREVLVARNQWLPMPGTAVARTLAL